MIRRRSHPASSLSTRRLEAYTDGVFAIAATLLVLDLTTRSLGQVRSDADLWAALGDLGTPVITFAVSFVLLSLMWATHVSQFEHIARIDTVGIWINNVRLLFIVLVPFTSSLLTDYSDYYAGRMLLPANFFVVIVISWVQWQWARRRRETTMPGLTAAEARSWSRGALSAVLLSAAVVALSPWAGSLAFFLFVLDGPLTRLLGGSTPVPDGPEDAASAEEA